MDVKKSTFKRGIHPQYNKQYTDKLPIEEMPAPKEVVLPMSMHIGAPCTPVVKPGDYVYMGQLVGKAGAFVSAHIHSSVSGTVKAVEPRLNMNGNSEMCVVIENDFKDDYTTEIDEHDPSKLSAEDILNLMESAGIVGLGGATFPARVKFAPPKDAVIDYLILNGAECEPYLTSDHALMRENAAEIVEGMEIMRYVLGLKEAYIGIEDNKPDAIEAMKKAAPEWLNIYSLATKYPQGGEKQLINAITGREVHSGALPASVGCIVSNVGTAYAVYQAVVHGIPCIERVVTVTGSAIKTPKVLRFRIGTEVKDIIDYCGGLTDDVAKVILGGPMMGFSIYDTAIPAVKGTSGILCLNAADAFIEQPSNCIKCGKCVEVCPMGLMPMYLGAYSEKRSFDKCEEYDALDCIECGCCAFTCPARRPLVAEIRMAKREIINKRKNG